MSHSELASPRETKRVLEAFGHNPKYKLGQNFLVDDNVIGNILELAGLLGGKRGEGASELPAVIEIGPGIGTLTVALLKHARVVSVERDPDLPAVLAQTTAAYEGRFALVKGDALKVARADVENACEELGAPLPRVLVANLPYQIAATVILDWFARFEFLDAMVVMVQSEVADRICAAVGTKDYGAYTVKLRLHARPAGRFQVPPSCFMPAPHVESAVIRLERTVQDESTLVEAACEVADAAFAQRRKNIRNSMSSRFDKKTVDELLAACDIDPKTRGETLDVETYVQLGRALLKLRENGNI